MTCIVGLLHKNKVYIGGDSAGVGVQDLRIRPRADEKVFWNGDFLIGIAGSFRMGNILRYRFDVPEVPPKTEVKKYMSTLFVDAVRKAFIEGELVTNGTEGFPGAFLVGYKKYLFEVQADYQVGIPENGYNSIGCGDAYALGSLKASTEKNPEAKVLGALEAAAEFSAGVQGPFRIYHT